VLGTTGLWVHHALLWAGEWLCSFEASEGSQEVVVGRLEAGQLATGLRPGVPGGVLGPGSSGPSELLREGAGGCWGHCRAGVAWPGQGQQLLRATCLLPLLIVCGLESEAATQQCYNAAVLWLFCIHTSRVEEGCTLSTCLCLLPGTATPAGFQCPTARSRGQRPRRRRRLRRSSPPAGKGGDGDAGDAGAGLMAGLMPFGVCYQGTYSRRSSCNKWEGDRVLSLMGHAAR